MVAENLAQEERGGALGGREDTTGGRLAQPLAVLLAEAGRNQADLEDSPIDGDTFLIVQQAGSASGRDDLLDGGLRTKA